MHNGPSPVIKVCHWREFYLYLYHPRTKWAWKRFKIETHRSVSGLVINRRIFAALIEVSWTYRKASPL